MGTKKKTMSEVLADTTREEMDNYTLKVKSENLVFENNMSMFAAPVTEEEKDPYYKAWRTEHGPVAFATMQDSHLLRVAKTIETRLANYEEAKTNAEFEIYGLNQRIKKLQQQITEQEKRKEIAVNSTATMLNVQADCKEEIEERGL